MENWVAAAQDHCRCQMQGVTIEEAKERLKAVIRQMMDEGDVS